MSTPRVWPIVTITFSSIPPVDLWEWFSARVLEETGCLGVQEIVPTPAEAGAPVPRQAIAFFPASDVSSTTASEYADHLLALAEETLVHSEYKITHDNLEDQDWGKTWRRFFRTTRVGERLYVGPPWEGQLPGDAPSNALLVQIDPGQAFGTGSHETTRICMRLLETHVNKGDCILDIGAGSGILSFAAVMLGASYAIGVEYDAVCEENFLLNADINKVSSQVCFVLSAKPDEGLAKARANGAPAPVFQVCNMLSERFIPLLPALRRIGIPLLLSGFLVAEKQRVFDEANANGFTPRDYFELEGWGAWLCIPKG